MLIEAGDLEEDVQVVVDHLLDRTAAVNLVGEALCDASALCGVDSRAHLHVAHTHVDAAAGVEKARCRGQTLDPLDPLCALEVNQGAVHLHETVHVMHVQVPPESLVCDEDGLPAVVVEAGGEFATDIGDGGCALVVGSAHADRYDLDCAPVANDVVVILVWSIQGLPGMLQRNHVNALGLRAWHVCVVFGVFWFLVFYGGLCLI